MKSSSTTTTRSKGSSSTINTANDSIDDQILSNETNSNTINGSLAKISPNIDFLASEKWFLKKYEKELNQDILNDIDIYNKQSKKFVQSNTKRVNDIYFKILYKLKWGYPTLPTNYQDLVFDYCSYILTNPMNDEYYNKLSDEINKIDMIFDMSKVNNIISNKNHISGRHSNISVVNSPRSLITKSDKFKLPMISKSNSIRSIATSQITDTSNYSNKQIIDKKIKVIVDSIKISPFKEYKQISLVNLYKDNSVGKIYNVILNDILILIDKIKSVYVSYNQRNLYKYIYILKKIKTKIIKKENFLRWKTEFPIIQKTNKYLIKSDTTVYWNIYYICKHLLFDELIRYINNFLMIDMKYNDLAYSDVKSYINEIDLLDDELIVEKKKEFFELLHKPDVNYGQFCLHYICMNSYSIHQMNCLQIILYYMSLYIPINITDYSSTKSNNESSLSQSKDRMKYGVEVTNASGSTALHILARYCRHKDVVLLLLSYIHMPSYISNYINICDNYNMSALELAKQYENNVCIHILEDWNNLIPDDNTDTLSNDITNNLLTNGSIKLKSENKLIREINIFIPDDLLNIDEELYNKMTKNSRIMYHRLIKIDINVYDLIDNELIDQINKLLTGIRICEKFIDFCENLADFQSISLSSRFFRFMLAKAVYILNCRISNNTADSSDTIEYIKTPNIADITSDNNLNSELDNYSSNENDNDKYQSMDLDGLVKRFNTTNINTDIIINNISSIDNKIPNMPKYTDLFNINMLVDIGIDLIERYIENDNLTSAYNILNELITIRLYNQNIRYVDKLFNITFNKYIYIQIFIRKIDVSLQIYRQSYKDIDSYNKNSLVVKFPLKLKEKIVKPPDVDINNHIRFMDTYQWRDIIISNSNKIITSKSMYRYTYTNSYNNEEITKQIDCLFLMKCDFCECYELINDFAITSSSSYYDVESCILIEYLCDILWYELKLYTNTNDNQIIIEKINKSKEKTNQIISLFSLLLTIDSTSLHISTYLLIIKLLEYSTELIKSNNLSSYLNKLRINLKLLKYLIDIYVNSKLDITINIAELIDRIDLQSRILNQNLIDLSNCTMNEINNDYTIDNSLVNNIMKETIDLLSLSLLITKQSNELVIDNIN